MGKIETLKRLQIPLNTKGKNENQSLLLSFHKKLKVPILQIELALFVY
jgi:hypothetical protein